MASPQRPIQNDDPATRLAFLFFATGVTLAFVFAIVYLIML
jgi:hypothetical protein